MHHEPDNSEPGRTPRTRKSDPQVLPYEDAFYRLEFRKRRRAEDIPENWRVEVFLYDARGNNPTFLEEHVGIGPHDTPTLFALVGDIHRRRTG